MDIPWDGFPLAKLLKQVAPLSSAQWVRFQAIFDPEHVSGSRSRWRRCPYVEGLRLDEAMHDSPSWRRAFTANPYCLRVAPYKYGFKSIKPIVCIDLVEEARS